MQTRSTTILGLIHKGQAAMAGDGQVTFDDTVLKNNAVKIRTMSDDKILAGFAGTAADALALYELLEKKIDEYTGNLPKAAVELAKEWRTDKMLQKLEAVIAVTDKEHIFLLSGTGDVIEPDDGIISIGSGGPFALAAARAFMKANPKMTAEKIVRQAMEIAADICIYTNHNITVEAIK
ncbi:MAG: ATP-dependent protease subunit HslV [candidate division Zixibacteria bacterium]|nr:ATP-dependent protease subunit HslV [candidate division Zixibacteria bacterium]MDH3936103.1 ATP-dependent protease subunit HslV [candidate division Zixibacteria bacterium]MDH4032468.1 ATP-dependent protease subunit HslV [candidate division Zixibacteria bacterium]